MESVFGRDQARGLQQGLVGAASKVSGRGASRRAHRGGFRSRREVPRRRQCSLCTLFPGHDSAISISPGPVHRSSIYRNKAAGANLARMLTMGQSRPWPDALEVMTGTRQMDATAILDYFAPLKKWLR